MVLKKYYSWKHWRILALIFFACSIVFSIANFTTYTIDFEFENYELMMMIFEILFASFAMISLIVNKHRLILATLSFYKVFDAVIYGLLGASLLDAKNESYTYYAADIITMVISLLLVIALVIFMFLNIHHIEKLETILRIVLLVASILSIVVVVLTAVAVTKDIDILYTLFAALSMMFSTFAIYSTAVYSFEYEFSRSL